jgi:hypothetical protein
MQWLVNGAQPNDSLFFHYSGHGGQTKDMDGDEEDGFDEVVYPVDFETAGHIVDDVIYCFPRLRSKTDGDGLQEMHFMMVQPLPPGCRLTVRSCARHCLTLLTQSPGYLRRKSV